MICEVCKKNIDADSTFCTFCGTPQKQKENIIKIIRIGRGKENDLIVNDSSVSRNHAELRIYQNKIELRDLNSSNGTFVNGKRIKQQVVTTKDKIQLGNSYILDLNSINLTKIHLDKHSSSLKLNNSLQKSVIFIGRAKDNDIVLENIKVSRKHAKLELIGNDWYLEDLNSTNKTYVNYRPIKRVKITELDKISIGGIPLDLSQILTSKKEIKGDVKIFAKNLTFRVEGKNIVDNISLVLNPQEFVGLIGPSGAGKTSLMLMMNGLVKPTEGDVYINDQSLFANLNSFKGQIGYVPQDDIIHRELTVRESLQYAALLRLKNYSRTEINNQVDKVIKSLDLVEAENTLIGSPEKKGISGGQRKRVNLGQELLTEPSILFLDEPTSGLDPKTDMEVMKLLKGIADKGKIVVLTTHNITTENFNLLTHLVVLTKGGKLAYFGPAKDATAYFNVREPYEIFDEMNKRDPDFWKKKFISSQYYQDYIVKRSSDNYNINSHSNYYQTLKKDFDFKQYLFLTSRYLKIKLRDKISTLILLLQAPLIAFLISLVFSKNEIQHALFVLVIAAIWLGCSNAAREIVGEQSIYKRERMVFLKIPSYLFSKITVLSILCIIQSGILTVITDLFLNLKSDPFDLFLLIFLTSISSLSMGLTISSLVNTNESAMAMMPIVLIPQVILCGMISKFGNMNEFTKVLSGFMISRWSSEASLILEFKSPELQKIIKEIGFSPDNLTIDIIIILLFFILFFMLTIYSLKRKEKY
jgi:ABC-type multidrug transport system ATPase subunit/pSer/pThr/pTyr-binding forkhead associated (FHA) protein